jgi:hypothetical protein
MDHAPAHTAHVQNYGLADHACTWRCCNTEALYKSGDGAVRLCRYHSALLLTRSDGPNIYVPESWWAAAQGRQDVAKPLITIEVLTWCSEATQ